MEGEATTIKIQKSTKKILDMFKLVDRDTYDAVIRRLLLEKKALAEEKENESDSEEET